MNPRRPSCQRHLLCQLAPNLFASRSGLNHIAMLHAYFDESGHPEDPNSKVVSVATVVSTQRGWHQFEEKWGKVLRRHNVRGLHMTDYENSRGEFKNWQERGEKRIQFIGDLASILKNNIRFAFICSLSMDDWNKTMPGKFEDLGEERRGPLMFMLRCCLEAINETDLLPRNQAIACMYESNNFLAGIAPVHFHDWSRAWNLDNKFASFTFAGKYDFPGLQGADMLAYEGRKHLLNQYAVAQGLPERKLHANLKLSRKIDFRTTLRMDLLAYLKTYYPDLLSDEEKQLCSTLPEIEPAFPPAM